MEWLSVLYNLYGMVNFQQYYIDRDSAALTHSLVILKIIFPNTFESLIGRPVPQIMDFEMSAILKLSDNYIR